MTLPSEEVEALNITREFLRDILNCKRMMKASTLRKMAAHCLRHFPWEYHIKQRWADDVCEHRNDRQFCQICKAKQ